MQGTMMRLGETLDEAVDLSRACVMFTSMLL